MKVFYCDGWFRAQKRPGELWTPEHARKAYDSRTLYAALIGDVRRPTCFVESNMDYVGVDFLDNHLRSHVDYQFIEKKPGWLFLAVAVFREFVGDGDTFSRGAVYHFKENGQTIVDKSDDIADEYFEANTILNVMANWEPYPAFGKFDSIIRRDRGLDLIH